MRLGLSLRYTHSVVLFIKTHYFFCKDTDNLVFLQCRSRQSFGIKESASLLVKSPNL